MPRQTTLRSAVPYMLATALIGSLSVCADVIAAEQLHQSPPQRIVNFADLDLTRDAGAVTLYLRIKSAAKQVCPMELDAGFPGPSRHRCIEQAINHAVVDVNAHTLTNYHLARTQQTMRVAQQR
jgi:UrcA family protein